MAYFCDKSMIPSVELITQKSCNIKLKILCLNTKKIETSGVLTIITN